MQNGYHIRTSGRRGSRRRRGGSRVYLYQKNQDKINEFLRSHGLDIPVSDKQPIESMNIEDLATLKERIEDLIAERELAAKQAATEATSAPAEPAQA